MRAGGFKTLRSLFVLLAIGAASLVHAQEWTDTRVGTYDFQCESQPANAPAGAGWTFVSGHQRFSLAARSCAAAAAANPTLVYQVRPATYKITLTKPSTTPVPTPTPTSPFALGFNPACSNLQPLTVNIGTAFVGPSLVSCYEGSEGTTATFEVFDGNGGPAPHGWAIDQATGVLSNPAAAPQASGTLLIRRTTASGVRIDFLRNWAIQ